MFILNIFKDSTLMSKILALILGLIVFRLLASIPVPAIDPIALRATLDGSHILSIFNLFSGGGLYNVSIVMLGVFPYITVAIVMQLMTAVSTKLNSLYNEEGEIGRKKFMQYTRVFSVPVALLNAASFLYLFQTQGIIVNELSTFAFFMNVVTIATGSMLLIWIGELVTEFGIGNGISLIVFAGIVVSIPRLLLQANLTATPADIILYIVIGIAVFIAVAAAIWMNEAYRPIPISYARHGLGTTTSGRAETYYPLKINPAGVLPIIFSLAILAFIQYMATFAAASSKVWLVTAGEFISSSFQVGIYYAIPATILIFMFTYFHTPLVLNTDKLATNLQKQGAFVPGLRPGEATQAYFKQTLFRLIFISAVFLALITVIPFIAGGTNNFGYVIGGSGIIIIVSVILDIINKIKAHLLDNQ